jgi:hypothetical protein
MIRCALRELRLVAETIDFAAVLGNCSEGDNTFEIEPQSRVNVVNMHFHILLGALTVVGGGDDDLAGTAAGVDLERILHARCHVV